MKHKSMEWKKTRKKVQYRLVKLHFHTWQKRKTYTPRERVVLLINIIYKTEHNKTLIPHKLQHEITSTDRRDHLQ